MLRKSSLGFESRDKQSHESSSWELFHLSMFPSTACHVMPRDWSRNVSRCSHHRASLWHAHAKCPLSCDSANRTSESHERLTQQPPTYYWLFCEEMPGNVCRNRDGPRLLLTSCSCRTRPHIRICHEYKSKLKNENILLDSKHIYFSYSIISGSISSNFWKADFDPSATLMLHTLLIWFLQSQKSLKQS